MSVRYDPVKLTDPKQPRGKWALVWRPRPGHPFAHGEVSPAYRVLACFDTQEELLRAFPSHRVRLRYSGELDGLDPDGNLLSSLSPIL